MGWPRTSLLKKGAMIGRMTIPCRQNGKPCPGELADPAIQGVNDRITLRHRQRPARQEIILDINDQQGIAGIKSIAVHP